MGGMKIAILGSGNVGGALGRRFAAKGHEILFGSRHPNAPKLLALVREIGDRARATSVREAVAGAGAVLLAAPWSGVRETLAAAGDLAGKLLIDCTNPLAEDLSGLTIGTSGSGGELVASWAKGARVVKAFNSTGAGNMEDTAYEDGPPAMLFCGDDAQAKKIAGDLIGEIGFEALDAGGLAASRFLEPFAMLWIHLAYAQRWGPDFAFRVIRR